MSQFWSAIVNQLTPYAPGEQPKIDNLIKLNTNENPYGPSPKVVQAIAEANGDGLRKYPDPNADQLKHAVAKNFGFDTNMVFVGNSSDEVLAHAFRGLLKHEKPLLFPDITYSFYPVYCKLFEIEYQTIPLAEDFTMDISDYNIESGGIIFANPNAPTGIALSVNKIEALLNGHPNAVVVVDEAYVDFADDSAVRLINAYPNVLVTQTLSKSRSLAGLRVGIALGQPHLIEGLERIKNSFHPYALDKLAIAGATAAFEDDDYLLRTCTKVISTRERTTAELRKLGFDVLPSSANFLFAKHNNHQAEDLFKVLRENKIIVRYFNKPRINNYIRISIGTDSEMDALIAVLSRYLEQAS